MCELREDSAPYVGYDYKEIPANADKTPLYLDGYESFGWVLEERPGTQPLKNKGKLVLRRDRKIVNKMELTRLQRHFEACLRELDQLEESRTARARICAVMTGILGTAFLAGSTFAVTHQPPMVALMVVLAVPGFAGWIAPWFLYRAMVRGGGQTGGTEIRRDLRSLCKRAQPALKRPAPASNNKGPVPTLCVQAGLFAACGPRTLRARRAFYFTLTQGK